MHFYCEKYHINTIYVVNAFIQPLIFGKNDEINHIHTTVPYAYTKATVLLLLPKDRLLSFIASS